jgi:hypothetical protein
MKQLLAILLLLLSASNSFAQSAPLTEDIKLSYYDSSRSSTILEVPFLNGSTVAVGMGQRFTHQNNFAYLDSIRVHFDAVDGDRLLVVIFSDSIVSSSGADLHYVNTGMTGELARLELDIEGLVGLKDFWHTITIPHVRVPKDFHVMIFPIQTSLEEFSSKFFIVGEMHLDQGPSSDSRSDVMITSDLITYTPRLLDGYYNYLGNPLGVDIHMDAFVDITSSSVRSAAEISTAVYPNPIVSNGILHVEHSSAISSISIRNILGAEMLRWTGLSPDMQLPLNGLSPGAYQVLITGETGQSTEMILVQ